MCGGAVNSLNTRNNVTRMATMKHGSQGARRRVCSTMIQACGRGCMFSPRPRRRGGKSTTSCRSTPNGCPDTSRRDPRKLRRPISGRRWRSARLGPWAYSWWAEFRCSVQGLCLTSAARSRRGSPSRQAGEGYREATTMISRKIKRRRLVGGKRRVLLVAGACARHRTGEQA